MDWLYPFVALPLFLTTALALSITLYTYRNRWSPGALPFIGIMAGMAAWTFFSALELGSRTPETQLFWMKARLSVIATQPAFLLLFTLEYIGGYLVGWRKRWFLFWVEPILFIALVWTNSYHGWIWNQVQQVDLGPMHALLIHQSWAFYVHLIYYYAVFTPCVYALYRLLIRAGFSYWERLALATLCVLPPALGNLLVVIRPPGIPPLAWTSFGLGFTCLAILWAVIRFRFLETLPLAQHSIIENLEDAVVIFDLQDHILYANPSACKLLEQELPRLKGQPAQQVFPNWTEWTAGSPNQGIPFHDSRHQRWYDLNVSALHEPSGMTIGKMITWHDVTDVRQIIENSPNLIFTVGSNDLIQSWNQACEKVLLYTAEQIIGHPYQILFKSAAPVPIADAIHWVFTNGETFSEIETVVSRRDGSHCHMVSRLYPLFDKDGQVATCVFANTDITERKLNEQALQRRLKELTMLRAAASASVEATSENELIEAVTGIIGDSFYSDNFGVLLVDEKTQYVRKHDSYRDSTGTAPDGIPLGAGICSKVINEGHPLLFSDITQENSYFQVDPQTHSELCVPLRVGNRIIGVINLESHQADVYSPADERLITTLAGQLSSAIERLRAEITANKRIQELLAISRISREITSVLDRQEVLDSIVRHAAQISVAPASGLFLRQPNNRLYLVAAYGVSETFIQQVNSAGVPIEEGVAVGMAVKLGHPVQFDDLDHQAGYQVQALAKLDDLRAALAVPLLKGDEAIGAITVWHRRPYGFSEEEEMFVQALTHQCVNAIENARLFEVEREQRYISEVLRETGSILSATLDLNSILDALLIQVERLVPYDGANLTFIDGGVGRVTRIRGYKKFDGIFDDAIRNLVLPIDDTPNLHKMVETKQPHFIPDTFADPDWIHIGGIAPIHSWVGAPVIYQDQVVAFFSLDHETPNFYQAEHARRLGLFAGQASLALQNARLFEETQQRLKEVSLLRRVIEASSDVLDLDRAMQQVCDEVGSFFHTNAVGFGLYNKQKTELQVISIASMSAFPQAMGMKLSLTALHPLARHFLEQPKAFTIRDLARNAVSQNLYHFLHRFQVTSVVVSPLIEQDTVVGLFAIGTNENRVFGPNEITFIQDIASQICQALERRKLFVEAKTQADRMAMLADLSEALNQPLTVYDVVSAIGRGAMLLADTNRGAVYLRTSDDGVYCGWFSGISAGYVTQVTEQIRAVPGGQLLNQTDPILIPDVHRLPETSVLRQLAEKESVCSLGLWPLVYEGHVVAAIGLYFDNPHEWESERNGILIAFTRQAAIAFQNAHLFEETRRRAAQQETLNHIIAAAATLPDLADLMETVLELALEVTGVEHGGLWIGERSVLRGLEPDFHDLIRHTAGGTWLDIPMTRIVRDWEKIAIGNPLYSLKSRMKSANLRSLLVVPLLASGVYTGEIALGSAMPREWKPEEIALVETVGRQVGSAAERLDLLAKTQEQAHQVQQIMDTVPEGVVLLGADRKILMANPAAMELLPVLVKDFNLEMPLLGLADREIGDLLSEQAEKVWRELRTTTPPRIFDVAARPLEAGSSAAKWVLVVRDVTEERDSLARIQMQERLATVGQLAAGIAHDFNNIMAAVVVYADLLSMQPNLSTAGREQISIIQQQIQRATSLIRQILDFSRQSVIEPHPLDILPFIKEFEKLLRRILPENINLRLAYQPNSYYMVKADPLRLQQVFMNLALNARDAMPGGGMLQITLARIQLIPDTHPPLPDLAPGNWVCLTFQDTGAGIQPENLPYIFDPFFTTKPVGKGTGLGLAQVYGILKQHGGSIDVQSQVNQGTAFTIYLPELTASDTSEVVQPNIQRLPKMSETILLVEDDQAARSALQSLMESQGLQVIAAEDGVQALKIFDQESSRVDLVVSDVVMPKMGGLALFQAIQEHHPETKFLFITGHPLDPDSQMQIEAGQVHRLLKPFSVQDFINTLRQLLAHNP